MTTPPASAVTDGATTTMRRSFPLARNSSAAVPLLRGLLAAGSVSSNGHVMTPESSCAATVQEAMVQLEAVWKVQTCWRRHKQTLSTPMETTMSSTNRRRRTRSSNPDVQADERPLKRSKILEPDSSQQSLALTPRSDRGIVMEHWLWKSLRAYGLHERVAAVQLIQRVCQLPADATEATAAHHLMFRLTKCCVHMLQQYAVATTGRLGSMSGARINRLVVELSAVLYRLMRHDEVALTYLYWPWLCRSIWAMASAAPMFHTAVAALSRVGLGLTLHATVERESEESTALQRVRQLNAACLWGPKHASVESDASDSPLSPLACLVGAYFLTADTALHRLIEATNPCLVSVQSRAKPTVAVPKSSTTQESMLERVSREALENVLERCREHAVMEALESHIAVATQQEALTNGEDDEERPNANADAADEEYQPFSQDDDQDDDSLVSAASVGDDDDGSDDEKSEGNMATDNHVADKDEATEPHRNAAADNEDVEMQHLEDVILHDDDDEDDDDDNEMDLEALQAVVAAGEARQHELLQALPSAHLPTDMTERRRLYIQACVQVLAMQHGPANEPLTSTRRLTIAAEDAMLESVCKIVKPPPKPSTTKVILRRAPTQEEFFRGSLTRNPVPISILKPDPTVGDLIQHIAIDLQMADSAELIEIIVANKILDVNLKLRVVNDVLWKNTLIESNNNGSSSVLASSSISDRLFSTGSAISIILRSSGGDHLSGNNGVTSETPPSALPPLVATYRLAGVDGEATEDTVGVDDLIDPETQSGLLSPEAREKLLEDEFGLTRLVTEGRGVSILLRSVQNCVSNILRRIRRDEVGLLRENGQTNPSWLEFKQSPPCHGLLLLRYAAMLSSNRKMLLEARAPSILLTLLLDVLKVLEVGESSSVECNPTAEILQELIEKLTSDIASVSGSDSTATCCEVDLAQDAAGMPLLLQSIETIALSPPLRSIIAKLLPFLTYGLANMSRDLAQHFYRHVDVDSLGDCEREVETQTKNFILSNTLIQTALTLPSNDVCNLLRCELSKCGFIDRLTMFIVKGMPKKPAPWSPALWQKGELAEVHETNNVGDKKMAASTTKQRKALEDSWRMYYCCDGIRTAFKMLTGLCRHHAPTQARISMFADFLQACHWLESTSDSTSARVETSGLGLLAETLLDEMMEGNDVVTKLVETARKKTRLRKKEISQEQRNKALLAMNAFGSTLCCSPEAPVATISSNTRSSLASILAPVVGLFQSNPSNCSANATKSLTSDSDKNPEKPAWLEEAELMQDEVGLTCAVCQEGRTFQPTELLGLYCYVKKVAIPMELCGSRACIDGTNLLKGLPASLPSSLLGTSVSDDWFPTAKAAASSLSSDVSISLTVAAGGGRRNSLFTTTVSAGIGIHLSCHRRARQADRAHPKAPKSEWEGAALRNSRVSCNVILPLVTCQSSNVPLVVADAALTDHMAAVAGVLGTTPKSTLWTVLHDVRLLLLRMSYSESLSVDCGGGSVESNCKLLFYQCLMADMNERNAQVDQPEHASHARALSSGLLAACAIVTAKDVTANTSVLTRAVADAATMGAITCVIFHNNRADGISLDESSSSSDEYAPPHLKRQWIAGRDYFLQSLLICAGRRHARCMEGSGSLSSRATGSRQRSSSFAEWDEVDAEIEENSDDVDTTVTTRSTAAAQPSRKTRRSSTPTIEDFQNALRPMVTFYAILDQMSAEYSPSMSMHDVKIDESAQRMVAVINDCQRSRSIHELLRKAKITMDHSDILELLQKGMVSQ